MSAAECPRCRKPMSVVKVRGMEVDHCRSCKGLWLDEGEIASAAEVAEAAGPRASEARRPVAPAAAGAFELEEGEVVGLEAVDCHYLRPRKASTGRLCRAYLTGTRVILREARYDLARRGEKGLGEAAHAFPLQGISGVRSESVSDEPSIRFEIEDGEGPPDLVQLHFRDPGWHLGEPRRLRERDAWLVAIHQARKKLGIRPRAPKSRAAPAPDAGEDLGAPTRLLAGKYEILEQLGAGGMGLVFRGMDRTLDRPVAIKKIRSEIKIVERDRRAFLREAKTSASLHHPFIVAIYEIVQAEGDIYLVFEFVDGETLSQIIDRKGRMPVKDVRRVLKGVTEALAFAHSRRFAHRDLKPSNIMLTSQGYAKVMDFGIARQLKDTTSRVTAGDASGTLAYMAPEQELGKLDRRSDLYALGVTVYQMLTGELPFVGPNFYLQKERMAFDPLSETAPGAPAALRDSVERCLRFDPEERFESVEAFARAAGIAEVP